METQNRTGRGSSQPIAWFALGAVVGVTAAMLLAPEKGSHTRRRIAKHVKSGKQSLIDSGQDAISRGRDLFERGREMAQEAADMLERGRRMAEAGLAEHLEETLEHTFERGF